jgi:transcriptional regulator with XRE-family HTH domain
MTSPHPIDVHVGARVRLRRMLVGMSQERLGEMIGVTFQQVQKYERGDNRIGASRLALIASTLGAEVGYFFENLNVKQADDLYDAGPDQAAVSAFLRSATGLKIAINFLRIRDPMVREGIVSLITTLAEGGSEADDEPT